MCLISLSMHDVDSDIIVYVRFFMFTVTDISELKADNKRESENVYERRRRERGEITHSVKSLLYSVTTCVTTCVSSSVTTCVTTIVNSSVTTSVTTSITTSVTTSVTTSSLT